MVSWIASRSLEDPKFPEGSVTSIYYDSFDLASMHEKVNSFHERKKIRIRWYSDLPGRITQACSFFEIKHKIGERRCKYRIKTEFSGAWLESRSMDDIELMKIPCLLGCPESRETLFPVIKINFKRRRFVDRITGARISVDYDITVPAANRSFQPCRVPAELETAVIEFKGSEPDLPRMYHRITDLGAVKGSFSKYVHCMSMIRGEISP